MTTEIDMNDGTHSRFDHDHYKNCQPCYGDHLDFMQDQAGDEQLDAMSEAVEYQYNDEQ